MKKYLAILLMIFQTISCSAMGRKSGSQPDGSMSFSVILSGPYSNAQSPEVKFITGQKQWEEVWQVAKGREEPLPAIPTVNFDHQCVIAAFMGQRSSSGYKIEISDVIKKGKTLEVHVKNYETPGMLTVMTSPFTLIRIPRGNYQLKVIEESVQ